MSQIVNLTQKAVAGNHVDFAFRRPRMESQRSADRGQSRADEQDSLSGGRSVERIADPRRSVPSFPVLLFPGAFKWRRCGVTKRQHGFPGDCLRSTFEPENDAVRLGMDINDFTANMSKAAPACTDGTL